MESKLTRIAMATGLLAAAGSTFATPPLIFGKWDKSSVKAGFHDSVPTQCIEQTLFAATEWDQSGANFAFDVDIIGRHPRLLDQTQAFDFEHVTFEVGVPSDPNAVMTARVGSTPGTTTIVNADVVIDSRRLQTTPTTVLKLSCEGVTAPPADKIDFQSAALHELGHVLGYAHVPDDTSCALYGSLPPGVWRRGLCPDEKQAHINNYGKRFRIVSIPNVTGPRGVNIPADVHYDGTPTFPVQRTTKNIECPSGWSCSDGGGTISSTPSPITFNFKCSTTNPQPTSTFRWRTTLTDANGVVTNAVEHTSTCTTTTAAKGTNAILGGVNRIIVTD